MNTFSSGIAAACLFVSSLAQALPSSNPFAQLESLEQQTDRSQVAGVRQLLDEAERLKLHGTARRYACELLQFQPDDKHARALLFHQPFVDDATKEIVWLDAFDATIWRSQKKVRDKKLGYCRPDDRKHLRRGMIRNASDELVSIEAWDRQHAEWSQAHEIDSRFFRFRSTIPLAAAWFVADDLDQLALAYLDYFEVDRLPKRRYTVHLYRNATDATAANADAPLLTRYGAYYNPPERTLHVMFTSLGGLTAVRHEAAHALNREYVGAPPPQWIDEGIGVLCQFAAPTATGTFQFGTFPQHAFGTRFVDEVKGGARERMVNVHEVTDVVTDSHYYSKFRSMVDFFMNADGKRYRLAFINTLFRRQGSVTSLVTLPDIDAQWNDYVKSLQCDPHFDWRPYPRERTSTIENVLARGTSAVLFSSPNSTISSSHP